MDKLMVIYHLRVDEQTNAEIERLAALEHRPKEYQVRHLIALGIKHSQQRFKGIAVESCSEPLGTKPPQRITERNGKQRWDGLTERRRA